MSILVLSLLGGLRDVSIGTDTSGYGIADFKEAQYSSSFMELRSRVLYRESGYLLVCYMANKVFGHLNWALFLYQLITNTGVYIGGYRYRERISFPFFMLMYCLMHYNYTLNAMRQAMACAIVLMGIVYLEKKHYLKFSLYIIAASVLHNSAVIAFPLLIGVHALMTSEAVLRNNWTKIFIMLGMAAGLIIIRPLAMVFMNIFLTSAKYSHYLMNIGRWGDAASTNLTHTIIMIAALFMITVYHRQAQRVIISGKGGVSFYQFGLSFCIVYYVAIRLFAGRVLMYSNYVNLIALSALPKLVKEKHLRFMVRAAVMSVVALSWWYIYVKGNNSATYPYVSVLGR